MAVAVLAFAGVLFLSEMSRQPNYTTLPAQEVDSLALPDTFGATTDTFDTLDGLIANQEGMRYYGEGNYRLAYEQFRRAVQISPDSARFHQGFGYTLMQMGLYEQARRELELSVSLNPGTPPEVYSVLGQAQLATGDTTAALSTFDEYLRRETRPVLRQEVQAALDRIRGPGVELLGEPVNPTETGRLPPSQVAPPGRGGGQGQTAPGAG
jgi:hypothetical protein